MMKYDWFWVQGLHFGPRVCSDWASKDARTCRPMAINLIQVEPSKHLYTTWTFEKHKEYEWWMMTFCFYYRSFLFSDAFLFSSNRDGFAREWGGRQRCHGHFEAFQPQILCHFMILVALQTRSSKIPPKILSQFLISQKKKIRTPVWC